MTLVGTSSLHIRDSIADQRWEVVHSPQLALHLLVLTMLDPADACTHQTPASGGTAPT